MNLVAEIGKNIRKQREMLGLNIEETAHLCDLSANHLGTIERGTTTPKIDTLYRISKALNLGLIEMIEGTKKDIPNSKKLSPLLDSLDSEDCKLFNKFIKDYLLWKKTNR